MSKLVKKYFTSNDTWTAPAGVTHVFIVGCGGGGGGNSGSGTTWGGGGGGGSIENVGYVTVVPNTAYSITIGGGGGAATSGSNTTFGSLFTCRGAGLGYGQANCWAGGMPFNNDPVWQYVVGTYYPGYLSPGNGGQNGNGSISNWSAVQNLTGYAGGSTGSNSGTHRGGGGGGGGPGGVGANGGAGNNSGTGSNGSSAAANTGAGGGGGGGGSGGNGTGGSGGSGYLYVIYVDG